MQKEIEATYLDIDHEALRVKLRNLGAVCEEPLHDMFRATYDYTDLRLDKKAAWIRVRQEGSKITMGYKQRQAETIDGMQEVEFTISDFDAACDFLDVIGLKQKARQETRREVWRLDDCEIMLDEWPWIPPYVEVEAASEVIVQAVSKQLGLDYSTALFDSADAAYMRYYDVTRTEICTVPLVFGPIPEWLEAKRR